MNIIKCPECDWEEHLIASTDGNIEEGWLVEDVECLRCGAVFVIKANFTDVKIEGDF